MERREDIFDIVDEFDQVVGSAPRSEVHANGWRHRAVHVFVFNADGKILLQLRSARKDKHPGTWDTSCCGHVDSGEDYQTAAVREMAEELGLPSCPVLTLIGKSVACVETGQEFVQVFACQSEGPFEFCPNEIDAIRWVGVSAMEEEFVTHPAHFAPALPYLWGEFRESLLKFSAAAQQSNGTATQ